MKFLDDIKALQEATTALLKAKEDLSNTMGDAARQLAEVQRAIADAPKPFTVEIQQNGQDFTVSEKDGMVLFAALTQALDHQEPKARLASGQTVTLRLTDLEQVAAKVIEAAQ